jgi:peptide/nickel transport system permease protein
MSRPFAGNVSLGNWVLSHQSRLAEGRHNVRIFLRDRLAVIGVVIVVAVAIVGLLAPVIAPYPDQGSGASMQVSARFEPPSAQHWFGTDQTGRDVLSRVFFGARFPLLIAGFVIVGCVLIGVPLGGIAGYYGGRIDEVIMRITDIFLGFPSLLLAIAFVAFLGPSLLNAMIALIISWWPWYTRLVRGVAVSLRERPYVEAAKTMGVRNRTIILRHILPGSVGPVIVQASLDSGAVILAAAGLSFIGLGAQPPTAEWGLLVSQGRGFVLDSWWIATFPALAIFILVLGINWIGDGLRDVLDPRAKR